MTLSAAAAVSEEWWTVVIFLALRILTAQVKLLVILLCVCMCVFYFPFLLYVCPCLYPDLFFCFFLHRTMDVIWLECTHVYVCVCLRLCVCLCVSVRESSLQRGGWSGLENILCDSTSGLAFFSLLTSASHYCGNSLTVHSSCFVQVHVLKGMMWQSMSPVNLEANLWGGGKIQCVEKQSIWFLWVWAGLYFILLWHCLKKKSLQKITLILWWNCCLKEAIISRMLIVQEVQTELSVMFELQFIMNYD